MNECSKMGEEELFEVFKSLQVHMRMSDLKTPTKEFVISVFETFLRDLQINLASPAIRPFESISHFEYPDLNEEGLSYILLAATMSKFLSIVCPVTITIGDIIAPKPKKTKKILNFLVVLWKYVIQKQGLYSQVCDALQPEIQKAEEISKECNNLDSKYEDLVEKLNSITTSKEELLKIFAVKDEINKKHQNTKEAIVLDYQTLKEKESQLQTEKVNLDLEFATNKEKINELDQLILSSPEKIKTDVQKLKDMIKDVEEKIQEKEQERKKKKKENQNKISSQEDLIKSNAQIQKLHNEFESLIEKMQTFTTLTENCKEENKDLKELQSAHETKEVMTNFFEKNYTKIQQLKKKQIEELNKTYEMLQRQLSEERAHSDSLASSISEIEKTIENEIDSVISIVDCCKNAEAETESYKSLYKEQMLAINNKFRDDCSHILKKQKKMFEKLQ